MEYLIVSWPQDGAGEGTAARLRAAAVARGMNIEDLNAQTWLATGGPRPPRLTTVGSWRLVGDVFNRRRHFATPATVLDDRLSFEQKIAGRFWGRYVGIRLGANGAVDALMRDPSGALECVCWTWGPVTLVASDATDWLVALTRPDWRIDFARVAQGLRDPLSGWASSMLDGPTILAPGTLLETGSPSVASSLWRPDRFARMSEDGAISDKEAHALLRDAVDEAVGGLVGPGGPFAAEISGGLDSAIVAGSLAKTSAEVRLWLNAFGGDPESDERPYACAVAGGLGATLTEIARSLSPMTEALLLGLTQGVRPGLNALDSPNDAVWAETLNAQGVRALLTGKGGDAVFIQGAGGDVFTDIHRQAGLRALMSPSLPALARWNGRSVWSLISDARRGRPTTPTARSDRVLPG